MPQAAGQKRAAVKSGRGTRKAALPVLRLLLVLLLLLRKHPPVSNARHADQEAASPEKKRAQICATRRCRIWSRTRSFPPAPSSRAPDQQSCVFKLQCVPAPVPSLPHACASAVGVRIDIHALA
jgi:hypothetical protein